jgi:RNA polymerase sigma-70 factor (ECF subfamily)
MIMVAVPAPSVLLLHPEMGTKSASGLSKETGTGAAPEETGDAEVVERVRSGDIEAFSILVRRYQKRMLNVAYRMCGDYEDSCDIVQDSFISAFKALKGFRGEASFPTWLTGIVMNNTRNRLRQRSGARFRTVSLDAAGGPAEEGRRPPDIPSGEPSPFDELGDREIQAAVQACIGTVEPEFREVMVLRDIRQHSYSEIGAILGLPEGTVKSRLFRARECMKECLKKKLGGVF